jgi:methylmalonyl-CoA mutase
VEPSVAARQVELELALGANLLEGIAAVRAMRLVWARGLELLGADPAAPMQLVVTVGERVLSRRDPWTNALRETAVAFAAAVGGADLIRLPAFDVRSGESAPARRLARNTPLILREEAGLARVADPAGGSWHLDAATGLFAERVWTMLGELDGEGELDAALESGVVAERIEAQRAAREEAVRTRRHALTGVSEFPDHDAPRLPAAAGAASLRADFPVRADAEPFERLQDAADAWSAANGRRGRLLLVRLGPATESAPRVAFARGVADVGGFEVVVSPEVTSVEQATAAVASSDAVGAVLCGADTRYATDAALVAAALKAAGLRVLLLAGRPGPDADALRAAGVDDFIFAGADIVAVLERLLDAAGVLR